MQKLASTALAAVCFHFRSVALGEEWLGVPSELVHALLADDRLRVGSEEEVYYAAIAWLRARKSAADAEAAEGLLALVRYPLVSGSFIADVISKEPLLMKSFIADVISEEPLLTEASCRRRGSACLYALGGTLSNSGAWTGAMERYDPLGDAWVAVEPTLGTARLYGVAALLDGRIYVAGGFSQATMASVECFDPIVNEWSTAAPMAKARVAATAGVLDGKLYVIGGTTKE